MGETNKEQRERVEGMAAGEETWDLSPNDHAALATVLADLRAAEADNDRLRDALEQSVRLQAHYAELLNMDDGGKRILFANADAWLARLEACRAQRARSKEAR